MSQTGPLYPGTVVQTSASSGGGTWLNPSNVGANDGSLATCQIGASTRTHYLDCQNFGFQSSDPGTPSTYIDPAGTINGIEVEIECAEVGTGSAQEDEVKLILAGIIQSTNMVGTVDAIPGTLTIFLYGGPTNDWGTGGLTVAQVVAANFGIAANFDRITGTCNFEVDFIRMTAHWTPSGGGVLLPSKLALLGVGI